MTARRCPTGRMWDAFVLGLPVSDPQGLTAHLAGCSDCQHIVRDRLSYYQSLVGVAREPSEPQTSRTIPDPLILTPLHLEDASANPESVLAAAGVGESPTFRPKTFASEDHQWVVKTVWDSSTGHAKLYVLSGGGAPVAGLMIGLSGVATEYLTDSRGCADLGPARWPAGDAPHVTVVQPSVTFSLNTAELPLVGSSVLVRSEHNDLVKVSVSQTLDSPKIQLEIMALATDLTGRLKRVAVRTAGGGVVKQFEPVVVFDNFEFPGRLDIYLFA